MYQILYVCVIIIYTMKKYNFITLIFTLIIFVACSSDDNSNDEEQACTETTWYEDIDADGLGNPSVTQNACEQPDGYVDNGNDTEDNIQYVDLEIGNYWTFDTETDIDQTEMTDMQIGRDSLYIASTLTQNGNTYYDFEASTESTGFMTNLFVNNDARSQDGKLYINGNFELDLTALGGNINYIPLSDVILLDNYAENNSTLSTANGTLMDNIQTFPLTINYNLETLQKETLNNFTVNSVDFSEVIKSEIKITITIVTEITIGGIPFPLTVVDNQEAYLITNYYARDIGLIQSDVDFSFTIDNTIATQLGIDPNIDSPSFMYVDDYVIN